MILAADNPVAPDVVELGLGLVAFLVLLFLLAKFAVPRFEALFEERAAKIEGGIKQAEQAQRAAAEALTRYRDQLADARAEAARIRDEARAEGDRLRAELRAEAQEEARRLIAQGEADLTEQRGRIAAEMRPELSRLAVQLAERIVGESLAEEAQRRGTVDRFLTELERGMPGALRAPGIPGN
ncbi:F0F1 ATP synthase subunit B [Amycolatopsis thermophila]|uniref:ATP synthase subunit b n=1 Tax=Amycolatopsis thermophila TaxID=206084 RepID=A0ABU0EQS8_9PSEU|nr:F0F1 ATP synthase subunit B [Amycolatopsis thermophila]MDQ0377627.1 F-type H+-transporting ATPase subunit b [Amycolatopsis thermophila]